jgi:hypothetical protein
MFWKNKIIILLILTFSFSSLASEQTIMLTDEETRLLQSIKYKDKRLESVKLESSDSPGRYNNMMKMMYNNNGIISIPMSPTADILKVKMCYKSPLMIELGESIGGTISSITTSSKAIVDFKEVKGKRKVIFSLVNKIDKTWENTFWIERSIDKKDYILKIFAEKCPLSKTQEYMSKIILEEKKGLHSKQSELLSPADYMAKITKGTPRDNLRYSFKVNALTSHSDSTWHSISVSIGYKEMPKNTINKDGDIYIKTPEFQVLDYNRIITIDSKATLLPESSILESRKSGIPVHRFNLMVNLTKRYIYEMKYVYLLIQFEDFHKLIKLPVRKLFEKSIKDKNYRI